MEIQQREIERLVFPHLMVVSAFESDGERRK